MNHDQPNYSQQFIAQLNNSQTSQTNPPINRKLLLSVTGVVAIVLAIILMVASSQQAQQRFKNLTNLMITADQAEKLAQKYQNLINDTRIRVVNKNFHQTLVSLNHNLNTSFEKTADKKQQAQFKKDLAKGAASLDSIIKELEKAELNELLHRSYVSHLLSIINQLLGQIKLALRSNSARKDLAEQLKLRYDDLDKIRVETEKLQIK